MVKGAQKLVNSVQLVIGLGFDSTMKDVDHGGLWMLSLLEAHSTSTNESKWAVICRSVLDG